MKNLLVLLLAGCALADDLRISPDSMRGHLSFIASDLLEGRNTPSRGLDLAAEYIAAQFRRIGLDPIGDDGYFQTASVTVREGNPQGFSMTVTSGAKSIRIDASHAAIFTDKVVALENVPIAIAPDDPSGKVVVVATPGRPKVAGAALVLIAGNGIRPSVFDSESGPRAPQPSTIVSPELIEFLKANRDARVTLHAEPSIDRRAKVRNVAGVLRGSDPSLRDTYVMLTAHYDHVGMRSYGEDRIFNGANDDGSGTVSVIEIASALAAAQHPKRSIVFMTFFGEELGMVGSRYYARHPLVPLAQTIADLNLEQVGRTDDSEGARVAEACVTGFTFSTLTHALVEAGKVAGVKIHDRPHTEDYFYASDNIAFAEAGVVAHTLGVSFEFPDYHGVGDEWQKIDYDNMAKIDRAVALGLLQLASDAEPPKWKESAATKKFLKREGRFFGSGPAPLNVSFTSTTCVFSSIVVSDFVLPKLSNRSCARMSFRNASG